MIRLYESKHGRGSLVLIDALAIRGEEIVRIRRAGPHLCTGARVRSDVDTCWASGSVGGLARCGGRANEP
jgi:hypothetical protein